MKSENIAIEHSNQTLVENDDQRVLRTALESLDGGNNWCQGHFTDGAKMCSASALYCAVTGRENTDDVFFIMKVREFITMESRVVQMLSVASLKETFPFTGFVHRPSAICAVNNMTPGDFAPVERMFKRAYELAGR